VLGVLVTTQQAGAPGVGVEVDDDVLPGRASLAAADPLGFSECIGCGWSAVFAVTARAVGKVGQHHPGQRRDVFIKAHQRTGAVGGAPVMG
jgi:hypothetical protein